MRTDTVNALLHVDTWYLVGFPPETFAWELNKEVRRASSDLIYSRSLKAVDTIGNCQRLDFTVDVSQHNFMHKNKHVKFELNIGHRTCEIIMEEKTPLSHEVVCDTVRLDG